MFYNLFLQLLFERGKTIILLIKLTTYFDISFNGHIKEN